jgi:hypothetical protein
MFSGLAELWILPRKIVMRQLTVFLAGALLTACDSTAPHSALRGTWGGDGALLVATDSGATLSRICNMVWTSTSLRFDSDGHFSVPGLTSRVGGPPPLPDERPSEVIVVGERLLPDDAFVLLSIRNARGDTLTPGLLLRRGAHVEILNCP